MNNTETIKAGYQWTICPICPRHPRLNWGSGLVHVPTGWRLCPCCQGDGGILITGGDHD